MRRVLVTGAGGSPAVNFTRSLRDSKEDFFVVGTDSDKYYLERAETDKKYLVPRADHPHYIGILNDIIKENKLEFLHVQNDVEMAFISENREKLHIKMFLPSKQSVRICQDKLETYKLWSAAGIKQPETILIKTEDDLKKAFEKFHHNIWIRDTTGAGGRGSIAATDYKTAKLWMDFKQGWGKYTAAECLTSRSTTWSSIWNNGKLVVAQSRERLYWELGKLAPSGVSGATGGGVTVSDPVVDEISMKAVLAVDKHPHGLFSVDLTYDKDGVPNPTEINIGRFFTTHYFFTKAGLNMPEIVLKLAFNEPVPEIKKIMNPLPEGLVWIRGMDFEPVLTTIEHIKQTELELKKMLGRYE
jgi:predicted ATP-grasp superfamily ATP-dependent carboligase